MGLGLFAVKFFDVISVEAVFFLVGGAFLAAYLFKREYGLLIPACIVIGLGVGSSLDSNEDLFSDSRRLGIGLGFIAIFVIALLYERRKDWWPLIPGLILVVSSIDNGAALMRSLFREGWPLILVVVGILILMGGMSGSQRRGGGGSGGGG
jgi:hypothetical protein